MISRLNRFTFVTALLLPVLRLGLMLPVHPQGLGTGGRLLLTRQAFPAVMLSAYKDRSRSHWKTASAVFAARTYLYYTINTPKSPVFQQKTGTKFAPVSDDISVLLGFPDCFWLFNRKSLHQPQILLRC